MPDKFMYIFFIILLTRKSDCAQNDYTEHLCLLTSSQKLMKCKSNKHKLGLPVDSSLIDTSPVFTSCYIRSLFKHGVLKTFFFIS